MGMRHIATVVSSFLVMSAMSVSAGVQLKPNAGHMGTGIGMVVSDVPVATADLKLMVTTVYYERQFMDPTRPVRSSAELGLFCFYGILPFPEVSANLYLGSEEKDLQGKLGVGGFYDIAVGGHAGLMIKTGVVIKNRFDISLFTVPVGSDSKQSYNQFFGLESAAEAEAGYKANGNNYVMMPYYGFMFTVRY